MTAVTWKGRPIEEYDREELLACIRWMAADSERERRWTQSSAQTYDAFIGAAQAMVKAAVKKTP